MAASSTTTTKKVVAKRPRRIALPFDPKRVDDVEKVMTNAYNVVEDRLRQIEEVVHEQLQLENPHELSLAPMVFSLKCAFKRLRALDGLLHVDQESPVPYLDQYPASPVETQVIADSDSQDDSDDPYSAIHWI